MADEFFDGGEITGTGSDELIGQAIVRDGGEQTYEVNVVDPTRDLRVALAWMDAPGDVLMNDLDLKVR